MLVFRLYTLAAPRSDANVSSGDGYSNPYRPPSGDAAPIASDSGAPAHASRGARLGASLIDAFVMNALLVPAEISTGVYRDFPRMHPQTLAQTALWGLLGLVAFVVVNGYFLATAGQTLGKRLLRIQVLADGRPVSAVRYVGLRYLPLQVVSLLPLVLQKVLPAPSMHSTLYIQLAFSSITLLDVLLIFRADRRCLHDHIAGTRVCRVVPLV